MSPPESAPPGRRRTFLQLVGAAAGAGALQGVLGRGEVEAAYVLEQGDRCVEFAPLSGVRPVEALYDYSYPTDRFGGPPGSQGRTYSSEGTTDLQRDRTSVLFLYDGPEGLSLVAVHGHLDGERDAGGTVTFRFEGVPDGATWVVRDDHYLRDGEPVASNYDRWDVDGETHTVDWAYRGSRTDGGALRGLEPEFAVTVNPAFNGEAALAADHDFGPLEAWEVVAGDRDDPERYPLRLDRPVTIRTGSCDDAGAPAGGTGDGDDDRTTGDDHRNKHERKQRKHREKHRKKRRKHDAKHRRKQEKHRTERKHRKHGG